MRHVARPKLSKDLATEAEEIQRELKGLFASRSAKEIRQIRFEPSDAQRVWKEAASGELISSFAGKCAYCERPIERESRIMEDVHSLSWRIDEFRPSSLYPELALDWTNLYPACDSCRRHKGDRFPVLSSGGEIRLLKDPKEPHEALLLDPCIDQPAEHLTFDLEGHARSVSTVLGGADSPDRGQVTIDVLALNRDELLESRLAAIRQLGSGARRAFGDLLTDETVPHLGMLRILVANRLVVGLQSGLEDDHEGLREVLAVELEIQEKILGAEAGSSRAKSRPSKKGTKKAAKKGGKKKASKKKAAIDQPYEEVSASKRSSSGRKPKKRASKARPTKKKKSSRKSAEARPAREADSSGGAAQRGRGVLKKSGTSKKGTGATKKVRGKVKTAPAVTEFVENATIESVSISNYKAIERFVENLSGEASLEVLEPDRRGPPAPIRWATFLGENGAGKSSVLEAIGLALAGPLLPERLRPDPSRAIRKGKSKAVVEVKLTTTSEPIVLEITRARGYRWSGPEIKCFVRGYGATRLPAQRGTSPEQADASAPVQLNNLFDPMQPLVNAESWLASLSEAERDHAFRTIRDLLHLGEDEVIDFEGSEMYVGGYPLEVQSTGFKTIVALACDMMAGLEKTATDMRHAVGVVLIDELGTHLHPTWKMALVPRLRDAFRGVQFITTTHEPLCLRGHDEGEVYRVSRSPWAPTRSKRKANWEATFIKPRAIPSKLRVDQLLTSEHFGMHSTVDPGLAREFDEYYGLLALSPADRKKEPYAARIEELRTRLMRQSVIGYTPRDQLVYEVIDQFLVREQSHEREYWRERLRDAVSTDDAGARDAAFRADGETRREEVRKRIAQMWKIADIAGQKS